jgi:hypothetical protein
MSILLVCMSLKSLQQRTMRGTHVKKIRILSPCHIDKVTHPTFPMYGISEHFPEISLRTNPAEKVNRVSICVYLFEGLPGLVNIQKTMERSTIL